MFFFFYSHLNEKLYIMQLLNTIRIIFYLLLKLKLFDYIIYLFYFNLKISYTSSNFLNYVLAKKKIYIYITRERNYYFI